MPGDCFDLANFDAEPTNLHLVVQTAEEFYRAVRTSARPVSCPIEPPPGLPLNGSGMNFSAVNSGLPSYPRAEALTSYANLPRHSRGDLRQLAVQN